MASVTAKTGACSVRLYPGDAKTLVAMNLASKAHAKDLAGFTIRVEPHGHSAYYLLNNLQFEKPYLHAQDPTEPATSSINAPFRKFRWVHVPGAAHQGLVPFFGAYTYTVTPRYFDANASMQPLDPSLSVSLDIDVAPFRKDALTIGFTRGFTQSQAFVRRFGLNARIRPAGSTLLFDTSQPSGVSAGGVQYTYRDQYEWLGFTARQQVFDFLNAAVNDPALRIDMFAYDLNEPDVIPLLIALAKQGRIRLILDNASLHHNANGTKPEDQVAQLFAAAATGGAAIKRGSFDRYSHDKVFVASDASGPQRVLTGSTNFSITGLYVNSNHVLVFDDATVAKQYADVFEQAWTTNVSASAFRASPLATQTFPFGPGAVPQLDVTFAPHDQPRADAILQAIADRVNSEATKGHAIGSVLFAVMELDNGTSPVYTALKNLHAKQTIFSYGISDSPGGIYLYKPKNKTGVLVTGKPVSAQLPPPFNQVPNVALGHQVHHKFVVCGFNGNDPVVYCGSSNLAGGGENQNGDNLLAIRDSDVATVFAIEALLLVDHFDFLDSHDGVPPGGGTWYLSTNDKWTSPFFDSKDLRSVDRKLFA